MNKRFRRAAALPLACLILAGCGTKKNPEGGGDLHLSELEIQEEPGARETDISQRYPEYFKYCFGEDASFTFQETDESGYDGYLLEYKDRTGALRTTRQNIRPYRLRFEEDWEMTEDTWYSMYLADAAVCELQAVFAEGFADALLEQELNVRHSVTDGWEYNDEVRLIAMGAVDAFSVGDDNAVSRRLAAANITPGTGRQVCSADWQSVAADEQIFVFCVVYIAKNADADTYTEKMNRIIEAYEHAEGTPKNYHFVLYQNDSEDSEERHSVMSKLVILGEEIDLSKMEEGVSYSDFWREKLIEKYK
ncbi:MAG: hypothetical protein IJ060_02205 [Oscillospiraceae bacterium]|nr:hypothetical protein [Oscillospiraceae bacterium]